MFLLLQAVVAAVQLVVALAAVALVVCLRIQVKV
jgi:hypothetical protein